MIAPMENEPTTRPLSYSRISTYLGCKAAHHYSYVENLTRKVEIARINRGTWVDKGLTAAIRAQEEGKEQIDCQIAACDAIAEHGRKWLADEVVSGLMDNSPGMRAKYVDLVAESQIIARRAVKSLGIGTGRWRTLSIDGELCLQTKIIAKLEHWPAGFMLKLDWLAEDKETGHIWVVDFKVRDSISSPEDLQFDYQMPAYQRCVEMLLGRDITGTAHFQVKSKVPKEPRILKNGELTRDVRGTDFDTYMAAIIHQGHEPSSFDHELATLAQKSFDVFTPQFRSREEVENVWAEIEKAAFEIYGEYVMRGTNESGIGARRLHIMQCRGCRFQDLCMAEMRGHDADFIRETYFTQKKERR